MQALSTQQIDAFRNRLEALAAALRASPESQIDAGTAVSQREVAGEVADSGDEALADQILDLNQSTLERNVRQIRQTEEALRRIEEGRFGVCADCGSSIALGRLQAVPTALRCLECERKDQAASPASGATL
jgi:DnaK suppressor protein